MKQKKMHDNVMDDTELVETLTREANAAKDALIGQLQGLIVSPAFDKTKQESQISLTNYDGG